RFHLLADAVIGGHLLDDFFHLCNLLKIHCEYPVNRSNPAFTICSKFIVKPSRGLSTDTKRHSYPLACR
ncbi:hypothetical protein, partial [Cronobacter sakazakii]|uniref:hypothetical protein n=1 Tax=Cronobacter sakazakii TaxID=28141 RepID=UPI00294AE62A